MDNGEKATKNEEREKKVPKRMSWRYKVIPRKYVINLYFSLWRNGYHFTSIDTIFIALEL